MKLRLGIILALSLIAGEVRAQTNVRVHPFTAAANDTSFSQIGRGLYYHKITWNISGGTLSACSVKIQSSLDQTTWIDLIAAQTCTSNGLSAVTLAIANYARISVTNMTTATGAPTLTVFYGTYINDPTVAAGGTSSNFSAAFPAAGTAVGGKATAAAPTYTEGQMVPFSLDLTGALRAGAGGGTSSTFTATFPATGTAAGFSDGTNMRAARVYDVNSGAGTEYAIGVNLRKVRLIAGDSVEAGTTNDPLIVDPAGITAQPVTGTFFQATQPISAVSLPLPTGAATAAGLTTLLTELQGKADLSETQPVSLASVPSHAVTNAGTFAVQENGAALTALQILDNMMTDEVASGTITAANGAVTIALGGRTGISATITGIWSAALVGELSGDGGVTWDQTDLFLRSAGSVQFAVGANGFYTLSWGGGGTTHARIRANTFTSGTVNVALRAGLLPMVLAETSSQGEGGAVPANAKQMGAKDPSGIMRYVKSDASGELQIDVLTLPALPTGTNNIGDVDVLTLPALAAGTNNIGDVDVLTLPAIPTGTNSIGTVQPGNSANTTPWLVAEATTAATANAASSHDVTSAASTNATSVKASAGNIYGIFLVNTTATLYYIRFYNLATAPTCSSATGFVHSLTIPALATGAGFVFPSSYGRAFSTGIAYCITAGPTSTDNVAAAVGIEGVIDYR